jgi:HSP20 family protein
VPTVTGAVPADAYRRGDHYVVHCDLPGVDPGSLDVSVQGDVVTVRAHRAQRDETGVRWLIRQRSVGTVSCQVRLGEPVQGRNVRATYADGVLTLTVPVASVAGAGDAGPLVHVLHGAQAA